MVNLRLTIEPTPASSRLATLANLLPRDQWNRLRRAVYRRAGHRCQTCGREGPLHCHEVWGYNPQTSRQWLRGLRALCRDCHSVKHLCPVRDRRLRQRLIQHFADVNRLTRAQTDIHIRQAFRRAQWLNQRRWVVDFGDYNLRIPPLADERQRRAFVRLSRPSYRSQPGRW